MQISNSHLDRLESETHSDLSTCPRPCLYNTSTPKSDILRASSLYPDDVSPPESMWEKSQRSSSEISPIEAPRPLTYHAKKDSHRAGIGIPIPKITSVDTSADGTSTNIQKLNSSLTVSTRWDEFSGEPTLSGKGKFAEASPAAPKSKIESWDIARSGSCEYNTRNININNQPRKRLSNKLSDHVFSPKEAWKGASGRQTIVKPLLDKPLPPGKSHTFPTGTQIARGKLLGSRSSNQNHFSASSPTRQKNASTAPSTIKNLTPLGFVDSSLYSSSSSFKQLGPLNSGFSTFSRPKPYNEGNPSVEESDFIEQMPNSVTGLGTEPTPKPEKEESNHAEDNFRARMHHLHLEDQPPSRFSTTTYATTTYDSPPATPDMNLNRLTSALPSPTLHRRRPIQLNSSPGTKVVARKPTPSEMKNPAAAESTEKHLKLLPKSPPEAQAVTRSASLEAKLETLRRRRHNLKTVIHELTNVVQPSSIAYDMASRQEIKKTVNGLNEELLEVIKDEHETGLQLHRAWKREDETSTFESSSLWVRRLAS